MESKAKSIIFLVIVGNKVIVSVRLQNNQNPQMIYFLKATMSILSFIYFMDLNIILFMKRSLFIKRRYVQLLFRKGL